MKILLILIGLFISLTQTAQKEAYNWCYGNNILLTFTTNPPSQSTISALSALESVASISDKNGLLLFYTNGNFVYNANHTVMANGNGLLGGNGGAPTNGATIVKQPGNTNIYYVFTLDDLGFPNGFRYSIVDMSLAAGMGSVTVKNVLLHTPTSEKCVAVRHCNGVDAWIVTHDVDSSNTFRTFLLTAAGINTVPVLSSTGVYLINGNWAQGQMKVSPNGKKLGLAITTFSSNRVHDSYELFDFDNANGTVSNPLHLLTEPNAYGCEFSPDGTKFYGSRWLTTPRIFQWDLCAGSNSAIVASQYSVPVTGNVSAGMQRTPDGRIFIARAWFYIGGFNSPNLSGMNCGFTNTVSNLAPYYSGASFPNFINTDLKTSIPFSFSNTCQHFSFSALPSIGNTCAYAANTVNAIQWNFGEPSSGASNISTLNTPTHQYANGGTYTVQLILQYDCYRDTIKQVIQVNLPQLSVSGKTVICNKDKLSLTVTGSNTYSWSSGVTTSNFTATPNANIVYTVTGTNTANLCSSSKVVSVSVNPCVGLYENETSKQVFVYPNPGKAEFNFVTTEQSELKIFNELGSLVYEGFLQKGENKINLHYLNKGFYVAQVFNLTQKVVFKIFKEE